MAWRPGTDTMVEPQEIRTGERLDFLHAHEARERRPGTGRGGSRRSGFGRLRRVTRSWVQQLIRGATGARDGTVLRLACSGCRAWPAHARPAGSSRFNFKGAEARSPALASRSSCGLTGIRKWLALRRVRSRNSIVAYTNRASRSRPVRLWQVGARSPAVGPAVEWRHARLRDPAALGHVRGKTHRRHVPGEPSRTGSHRKQRSRDPATGLAVESWDDESASG
jgi:hypothetical protein